MIVTFEKKYLRDLFEKGKTDEKKYRFQPEIIRRYQRCIKLMIDVPDLISLGKYNGLNLEKLKGDKVGKFSVRVNNQYRIEVDMKEENGETVTTICNITELSNHYK